jgi:two-component system chemotaxis response regulator CheB
MQGRDGNDVNIVVVNDSPYFLSLLENIVKSRFNVYAKFTNAYSALDFIYKNIEEIDVILLDLELPDMDGISLIEKILSKRLIPIIVTTAYDDSWLASKVISIGAYDFISLSNTRLKDLSSLIISRIELALILKDIIRNKRKSIDKDSKGAKNSDLKIVVIGASTGAPKVVADILAYMPRDINACIMIVQHMPKGFTENYAKMLAERANINVKVASDGDKIVKGLALVAPADYHMIVEDGYVRLDQGIKYAHVRPSANVTMITAARHYGHNVIGVLLSGMGFDGALGMKVIKAYNGITIAQDEGTSVVYGMARVASNASAVDLSVPADKIAYEIVRALKYAYR